MEPDIPTAPVPAPVDVRIQMLQQSVDAAERRTGDHLSDIRSDVDALRAAVHESYAGGRGLGPRVLSLEDRAGDGPSWSWVNPLSWWDRASGPNAAGALRVFARIVLLALVVWVVWRATNFAERYLVAFERRAEAEEQAAQKPPVRVNVTPPVGSPADSTLAP